MAEPLIAYLVRWRNRLRSSQYQPSSHQASPRLHPVAGASNHEVEDALNQSVICTSIVTASDGEAICRRPKVILLQLVDTSLLKCYLVTNLARIGPLLRQENFCDLQEAERILTVNRCFEVSAVPFCYYHFDLCQRSSSFEKKSQTSVREISELEVTSDQDFSC